MILQLPSIFSLNQPQWRPCIELKRDLVVPCKCAISADYPRSIEMNCDRVIFTHDTINILRSQPIVSISQRNCGYRILPADLINSDLNLRKLDLSCNSIYRLMDHVLHVQRKLRELRLADNFLGDNLNPIFSSNEFHSMEELEILDLSRNSLRNIEEGILKGCTNLEELYLDGNNLTTVPTTSLKGPRAIKVLSLAGNNIENFFTSED
ncbi:toll-like receptor 11 isoform X1 [Pogonomyrmex barbatus]|uniref:Toll-like receptor 11 isoform X1 n=1 Tax=Pogonomyrmex barbatus TaxID=144034 RepID=A0A6I9VVK1_9HYME|nr:toll-like receptor 11 isoform X1 [Pogonomyrmex barbatus]